MHRNLDEMNLESNLFFMAITLLKILPIVLIERSEQDLIELNLNKVKKEDKISALEVRESSDEYSYQKSLE